MRRRVVTPPRPDGWDFVCTMEPGYDGDHVAGTGVVVAEVWPQKPERVNAESPCLPAGGDEDLGGLLGDSCNRSASLVGVLLDHCQDVVAEDADCVAKPTAAEPGRDDLDQSPGDQRRGAEGGHPGRQT